uniref:Uncharacterized protein n=1 Tax=Anguilla anguilla TaxID=7936 RepID=A0A0E9RJ20_ANGAN
MNFLNYSSKIQQRLYFIYRIESDYICQVHVNLRGLCCGFLWPPVSLW